MNIRESMQTKLYVIIIALVITIIAVLESVFPAWAPFFFIYAITALLIPILLQTFSFGSFTQLFKSHWKLILVVFLITLVIDQGIFVFLYEQILAVFGVSADPYFSLNAAINYTAAVAAAKLNITTDSALLIYAAFILIWAPIGEELFYRGFMQGVLRRSMRFVPAALVSSLFFGIRHLTHFLFLWPEYPLVASIMFAVSTFVFGMFLSYLYEKTKSLYAPILIHLALNIISAALSM